MDKCSPIDSDAGARLRSTVFPTRVPFTNAGCPKRQRLQRACFTSIVWANEYNALTEFDVDAFKRLEIFNAQTSEHNCK
jgi:hypothetical protein